MCLLVRRRQSSQFIFSEPIHFLPEGIDTSRPLVPQVKASAAATAQATKKRALDLEDINVGFGTSFVGSDQIAPFRAEVLDAHGTMLHKFELFHDRSDFDEVWAYSYTSTFKCILPDGCLPLRPRASGSVARFLP